MYNSTFSLATSRRRHNDLYTLPCLQFMEGCDVNEKKGNVPDANLLGKKHRITQTEED